MTASTPVDTRPALPDRHFIRALGLSMRPLDGGVEGRVALTPAMRAPGTRCPRLAILATLVDVVAGHVPDGPRTPTIDLRIQTIDSVPEDGEIRLFGRALRVGRRLVVAETRLADASGREFAIATTTFKNQVLDATPFDVEVPPGAVIESFEALVGARVVDATALELDPAPELSNGRIGTVQGGVQAFLAELAAERVAGPGARAVDLDIRFLSRLSAGPLRARAERIGEAGGLESVAVRLEDAGDEDRLVSTVSLLLEKT